MRPRACSNSRAKRSVSSFSFCCSSHEPLELAPCFGLLLLIALCRFELIVRSLIFLRSPCCWPRSSDSFASASRSFFTSRDSSWARRFDEDIEQLFENRVDPPLPLEGLAKLVGLDKPRRVAHLRADGFAPRSLERGGQRLGCQRGGVAQCDAHLLHPLSELVEPPRQLRLQRGVLFKIGLLLRRQVFGVASQRGWLHRLGLLRSSRCAR